MDAVDSQEADIISRLAGRDTPCPGCGYNLRDLPTAMCPECGRTVTVADLAQPGETRNVAATRVFALAFVFFGGPAAVLTFGFEVFYAAGVAGLTAFLVLIGSAMAVVVWLLRRWSRVNAVMSRLPGGIQFCIALVAMALAFLPMFLIIVGLIVMIVFSALYYG